MVLNRFAGKSLYLVLALVLGLTVLLAACGDTPTATTASTTAASVATTASATTAATATTAAASATTASSATTAASATTVAATTAASSATTAATSATTAVATTTEKLEAQLNIYSTRREDLLKPLVDDFMAQNPGVKVNVKYGAGELNAAVIEERNSPKSDLLVGSDAAVMENLRLQGVLGTASVPNLNNVPAEYRAPDGSWTGVSGRVRIIQYNKNLVKEADLPKSIFELTDPKWKGKVAFHNSADASWVPQLTAIRLLRGEEFTKKFLTDLLANNVVILKSSTDIRKAVGKGEVALGVTNHYYYHLELKDGSPVGVVYPDQGASDIGAMYNTASVAFIKGAQNPNAAKAFMNYLLSSTAQKKFAELNFEVPVIKGIATAPTVKTFEEVKLMNFGGLTKLSGDEISKTRKLLDTVGWQ